MNDQSTDSQKSPEFKDRYAERRQRRETRRAARFSSRSGSAWIGGIILIGVGVILLLQNLTIFTLTNWWALFILIPALGSFAAAWRSYQAEGNHLKAPARGALFSGLIFTMLAAVFLFNLNLTILGPVLLMLAGIGLILNMIAG